MVEGIVILGASGHAKVIADIVRREGRYHIEGLVDECLPIGSIEFGYQVLGRDQDLPKLVAEHSIRGVIVGIGDNYRRSKIQARAADLCPGIAFPKVVHPAACIAESAHLGDGTVVMAGVVVNPSCSIGRACILNTNSSIDHDCVMGDYASLAPGVSVGGNCKIGDFSAICIGATLRHNIVIGEHSLVGAGATVLRDVPSQTVAFGTPAKLIKARNPGDQYL